MDLPQKKSTRTGEEGFTPEDTRIIIKPSLFIVSPPPRHAQQRQRRLQLTVAGGRFAHDATA